MVILKHSVHLNSTRKYIQDNYYQEMITEPVVNTHQRELKYILQTFSYIIKEKE